MKDSKLIKLGELSIAGAVLAGLNINTNVQKTVKAANSSNNNATNNANTQTLDTNALTRMMHKNTDNINNVNRSLTENKLETNNFTNNGCFDNSWGELNVSDWQGHVDGDYFVLDKYTGDPYHVIVPNAADLQKAGIDTQGKQVGVTSTFMHDIYMKLYQHKEGASIAFSKTDGHKIKAIDSNWAFSFSGGDPTDSSIRYYLTKFDGNNLDTSNITDMNYMFNRDQLSDLNGLKNWNTSHVTDMGNMFYYNNILDLTPLKNWNVNNVTNMKAMFLGNKISDLTPLKDWDTSHVTNMSAMFDYDKLSDLAPLKDWDTSNVTDLSFMFDGTNISDLTPLKDWDTSNVTNMKAMFQYDQISDLTPLKGWNTNKVTNMEAMFSNNQIPDLTPLKDWNTSKVTNMNSLFNSNKISDLTPLKGWSTNNVTNMSFMFDDNKILDLKPLKDWNTSKVTDMSFMLRDNQISDLTPIKDWDTSNVNNMNAMFFEDKISDLTPLKDWDTSNVNNMSAMFFEDKISDLTPLKDWDTSHVTDMDQMFSGNDIEKAAFSKWDFSKIKSSGINLNNGQPATGLAYFIDSNCHAIINLDDNSTLPDWFMQFKVNDNNNDNIFTTSQGNHIILTSNSKLLANPNKAFNKLTVNNGADSKTINTPVFINSTPDGILQDSKDIRQKAIKQLQQQFTSSQYNFKLTSDDANNPINILNATYNINKQYTIKVQFKDIDTNQVLDTDTQALTEPDNNSQSINYNNINSTIDKLKQTGYDVSNIANEQPESILGQSWNSLNVNNHSTDAYSLTNDDGNITLTYNISHRKVKVTHDTPKSTSDLIPNTNKHFPTGLAKDDLNTTNTIPIKYMDENNNAKLISTDSAKINRYRDATVDAVTGKIDYTDWQGNSDIEFTAPHGYLIDASKPAFPEIPGYTTTLGTGLCETGTYHHVPNPLLSGRYTAHLFCTGIDTPASIGVQDQNGTHLDKYSVQTHGHYGSIVDWNGQSTPDKINSIIKQMKADGYSVDTSDLNPDQFKDTEYSDATKDKPLVTIVGKEREVKVSHEQPKTTDDIIEGSNVHFPKGIGQDDLNKTITRTIVFKDPDGKTLHDPIIQTVHLHRDATVNVVTGAIEYTNWTSEGSFDAVPVPKVDGYTADKNEISKVDNPQIGQDYNTSVIYSRNDEEASITYIDDTTGKVLKTDTLKPKFNDPIKFDVDPSDYIAQLKQKGYDLVSNNYKNDVVASSDPVKNKFTVHVKHHLSKVERNKDVHENIFYKLTNATGQTSNESSQNKPVLHFVQTGIKDAVTGKTNWNGKLNSQTFSSVNVAKKPGYVASVQTIPAKTVTITNGNWNKDHDINTTVDYKPAQESVKLVIKDEKGNIVQTIVKTGKFGDAYDFTGNKAPQINGYTFEKASSNAKGKFSVDNKDIVLTYRKNEVPKPTPQPKKSTRTPEDTSVFKQNISAQKNDNNLPEMAEAKQNQDLVGIGVTSLLGLVSLAGVQVKKRVRKDGKNQA